MTLDEDIQYMKERVYQYYSYLEGCDAAEWQHWEKMFNAAYVLWSGMIREKKGIPITEELKDLEVF